MVLAPSLRDDLPELSLKERIQAEKARRSLYEFVKQGWHVIEPATPFCEGWHLEAICHHLESVTRGDIRRLLINIPPRHAKSLICSVFWPMWVWIEQPHFRWMGASYALSLASRDNRKCKMLIESDWYQARWGDVVQLSTDQRGKTRFETTARGYRLSVSVESSATGEGGDGIICLAPATPITTDRGVFPIAEIVDKRIPAKALSYNHHRNRREWKEIEVYEKSSGRRSVRVSFSDGRFVEATHDHPFSVIGKGYVQAEALQPDDAVVEESYVSLSVASVEPIATPEYVYNLRIADNHNYFACGVLTHNCDDPHSVRDASSDVKREDALYWFDTTLSTRLNDPKKGVMVIVMQRLHERDVSGHVLAKGGYEHLCLPAEFRADRRCTTSIGWSDPRTVEGELLWPAQVPQKELDALKKSLGPQAYSAQFQQDPVTAGGNVFKAEWFRYFSVSDQFYVLHRPDGEKKVLRQQCWLFATVDLAISKSNSADYTVIATWAVTPDNDLLLVELLRERLDGPEAEATIKQCYARHRQTYIVVEATAYQLTMTQQLARGGVPVKPYKPHRDKVSRAISASTFYAAGQVYHQQFAAYLTDLETELVNFPVGAHDDTVDAVSCATSVAFDPAVPNIRSFDDEADILAPVVAVMERGRHDDWGDF